MVECMHGHTLRLNKHVDRTEQLDTIPITVSNFKLLACRSMTPTHRSSFDFSSLSEL